MTVFVQIFPELLSNWSYFEESVKSSVCLVTSSGGLGCPGLSRVVHVCTSQWPSYIYVQLSPHTVVGITNVQELFPVLALCALYESVMLFLHKNHFLFLLQASLFSVLLSMSICSYCFEALLKTLNFLLPGLCPNISV